MALHVIIGYKGSSTQVLTPVCLLVQLRHRHMLHLPPAHTLAKERAKTLTQLGNEKLGMEHREIGLRNSGGLEV
jgi:hypothetical protein